MSYCSRSSVSIRDTVPPARDANPTESPIPTGMRRSARLAAPKGGGGGPGGGPGNRKTMAAALPPEPVPSSCDGAPTTEGEAPFDPDDYQDLQRRYLQPRVRENAELGGGMTLRRQTVPAIIDQDKLGYRRLKRRIASLSKANDDAEIYRLLRQLRDWEIHAGSMPTSICESRNNRAVGGSNEVVEMVDLTQHDEEEPIDVDAYIVDILLVQVKVEEEDPSTFSCATRTSTADSAVTPDAVVSLESTDDPCRRTSRRAGAERSVTSDRPSSPEMANTVIDVDAEDPSEYGRRPDSMIKWTRGEDDDLLSAVSSSSSSLVTEKKPDWSKIASQFPGRTSLQCLQRYQRLNPMNCDGGSCKEGRGGTLSAVTTRARAKRGGAFILTSEECCDDSQSITARGAAETAPLGQSEEEEETKVPQIVEPHSIGPPYLASIVTPSSGDTLAARTENASGLIASASETTQDVASNVPQVLDESNSVAPSSASIVTPSSEGAIDRTENASGFGGASSHRPRHSRRCKGSITNYAHFSQGFGTFSSSSSSFGACNEGVNEIADRSSTVSRLSSTRDDDGSSSEWVPSSFPDPFSDESLSRTSEVLSTRISERGDINSSEDRAQRLARGSDDRSGSKAELQMLPSRDCSGSHDAVVATTGRRKRMWTDEDDALLREAVEENGDTNWARIASRVPGRDSSRCRERWYNQLDPRTNRGEWTPPEDGSILEMQREMGNKWSAIANKLGTGRTGDLVKHRAHQLMTRTRRLTKSEGCDEPEPDAVPPKNKTSSRKRKEPSQRQYRGGKLKRKRAQAGVTPVGTTRTSSASIEKRREGGIVASWGSHFLTPNSIFHHDCLGSWKCRHGRSRARQEVCPRCIGISDYRLLSGAMVRDNNDICLANRPLVSPQQQQRICNLGASVSTQQTKARGAFVPFDLSFKFRGRLPDADTSRQVRLQGRCGIILGATLCQSDERHEEDDADLRSAWREQSRRRRKGEWRPTGGWKPPSWVCRQGAPPPLLPSSNTDSSPQIKVDQLCSGASTATSHVESSMPKASRSLCVHVADLLNANLLPSVSRSKAEATGETVASLDQVRYPVYHAPCEELLTKAHSALNKLLPEGDCDCIDSVRIARQYYNHWRPKPGKTRVILLAESHAFTSKDRALCSYLKPSMVPNYQGPREFISLVYSLAYGENEAVETSKIKDEAEQQAFVASNKGTPQFWQLLACLARGTHATPATQSKTDAIKFAFAADVLKGGGLKVEDRLMAKVAILEDLRERGIWLLDASVVGWYITQKPRYRRSRVTNEVHRMAKERPPKNLKTPSLLLSWEMYTKHVIRAAAEEGSLQLLIPIGKEVEASLTRKRLEEAVAPASARVTESFPAPNAWIPGGYGPFFSKLAEVVHEVAPPLPTPKVDLV